MAIKVIEKIQIFGSDELIASYMFNPQKDPSWISGILEVKNISKMPVEEGTEIHRIAHFMGRDVDYILKVTKLEKDRVMSMDSIKGPFPMNVDYIIDPNPDQKSEEANPSCTVRIHVSGESKGYFMFIDRLLSILVSQNVKGDLQTLKNIIEGEVEEEGTG